MKIFIGLGNFEDRYKGTRHNVGRDFCIWFAEKNGFSNFEKDKYSDSKISYGIYNGQEIEIVLPETYMNLSGESVAKYFAVKSEKGEVRSEDIYVFQDDIDLNFGEVKMKEKSSGSGGHNGIESLFQHLKTKDFKRIKIGIIPKRFFLGFKKPARDQVTSFVLSKFSSSERGKLDEVFEKTEKLL
jgi:PTH1 family peptidyl-tRNA hydrolase